MPEKVLIRTRNFMRNKLLNRRQMAVEVTHAGKGTVPKSEVKERIVKLFKCQSPDTVVVYGFKTVYGGGRSTGFCTIYDSLDDCRSYEPKYRLTRLGIAKKKKSERKTKKEAKKRNSKFRGADKTRPVTKKKKGGE